MNVASVLLGALGGGLITYLAQNYARLLGEDVARLNDHIADLEVLEAAVTEYWLSSEDHGSAVDQAMRARIRGALSVTDCIRPDLERLLASLAQEYRRLDANFFDLATGGSFETHEKAPDHDRAASIMVKAHQMKALLRRARRSLFWFR